MTGTVDTPAGAVPLVRTRWTARDTLGAWKVRWAIGRDRYRVDPGLYGVGAPDADSPVLATANYKLTFDALRRALAGRDAWLLVLDTRGINVWCAAGEHRFSTDELVHRVTSSGLDRVVAHRTIVLPQLGATGVAAHLVAPRCGFRAVFGPVKARDLAAFLDAGMVAGPGMRDVRFGLRDRLVLAPVELVGMLKPAIWVLPVLAVFSLMGPWISGKLVHTALALPGALVTRGFAAVVAYLAGALAGTVLTPVLLPWLPGRSFWVKGVETGIVAGAAVGAAAIAADFTGLLGGFGLACIATAVSAWAAMNFTGASTYTSPTGVEAEMRRGMPVQAALLGIGLLAWLVAAWVRW